MRWLELLGLVPKGDHSALRFREAEHWVLEATSDGAAFFRAVALLAPPGSIVYLEGSTDKRVPSFLGPLAVPGLHQVARGTIFPRPDTYHVPVTPQALDALADLIDQHGIALPAIHTALYDEQGILLSWYDSFTDEEMRLSSRFAESVVREFAQALGVKYRWLKHAA